MKYIVRKQASPPTKLEIGSARKTPSTPSPHIPGSSRVRGTTMNTFLSSEKKTAWRDLPTRYLRVWPLTWKAIMKKPKKKIFSTLTPSSSSERSLENIRMKTPGISMIMTQARTV